MAERYRLERVGTGGHDSARVTAVGDEENLAEQQRHDACGAALLVLDLAVFPELG